MVFHAYNKIHGSRSKVPSKNFVRQQCKEGFNFGVKGLIILQRILLYYIMCDCQIRVYQCFFGRTTMLFCALVR
jgi:hypothetical protein